MLLNLAVKLILDLSAMRALVFATYTNRLYICLQPLLLESCVVCISGQELLAPDLKGNVAPPEDIK
jgi:hypothetical protein